MIQVYAPFNTDFDYNGDLELFPVRCELQMKLNDVWNLNIEVMINDDIDQSVLCENSVICVDTPIGKRQLFTVVEIQKTDDMISATALPVFLNAGNECFLFDCRPVNMTGQQTLDKMMEGTPYKGYSDISKANTAYYIQKNLIECIASDDENSFLNRWGGEIIYKNFEIHINEHAGQDKGLKVEFGFNLAGIKEKVDMADVITRIIPKAYNGYILPNNDTVDSDNINKYPRVFNKVIEYNYVKLKEDASESDLENGSIVCENLDALYKTLKKEAEKEYSVNKADIPLISYDVDMIDLSDSDLYKDYEKLTSVSLGDIVHVRHRRLNIDTNPKVIEMKYDCILQKITKLTLGQFDNNYFNQFNSINQRLDKVIDPVTGTVMGNKVKGYLDCLETGLRMQNTVSKKQDVRAILFEDLDPASELFGALSIGTKGIQIADRRTPDGSDWKWGTAIGPKAIYAGMMITGILADANGTNYWNLDTGEFVSRFAKIQNAEITGNIKGGTISINDIFKVDADGNVTMKKGSINIADLFIAEENGNVTVNKGTFKGDINTENDIKIGSNLYMVPDDNDMSKRIIFGFGEIQYWKSNSGSYRLTLEIGDIARKQYSSIELNYDPIMPILNGIVFYAVNGDETNRFSFNGNNASFTGNVNVHGSLVAGGYKNRIVETDNYGTVRMNSVESADCVFTDSGSAVTDDNGFCVVDFDKIWMETVSTDYLYTVMLSECSEGSVYCAEKGISGFSVKGTQHCKFDWIVMAKQKGYEEVRMEEYREEQS